MTVIEDNLLESIRLKQYLLSDKVLIERVYRIADLMIDCYRNNGKVLICGNGGSAADAQHLASELSARYYYNRDPLFCEALHVNSSYVTAAANDFAYDQVFSRLVQAMGRKGDILIALSTSGNSKNVIQALTKASELGMHTVGFTGGGQGEITNLCEFLIAIPSKDTPRIQECHMILGHSICEIVEAKLFPESEYRDEK